MESLSQRAARAAAQGQDQEKRRPAYIVRAKVGPRDGNWATIGAVWPRKAGEGFVLKLHTLPLSNDWGGLATMKPPRSSEEESQFDEPTDE